MNYEEKYKEGLAEARKHYNSGCATEGEKRMLERLYSELKESEDEKMREEIIEFLTDGIWRAEEISKVRETQKYAKWIAYLEKQKEQKLEKNSVCPSCLDEAIRLYYFTYGNGKGGFDYLSLSKFQDIVEELVKEYGQKPAGAHSYLENSVDISPSDTETDFAEEYAYGVFEELKKKFKENGNFSITCDEASNIALNAILDGIDWFKKQAKDEKECVRREEQKPVSGYAFPKFRVGDTVYRNGWDDHTIEGVYFGSDLEYICRNTEGIESYIPFSEQDEWELKQEPRDLTNEEKEHIRQNGRLDVLYSPGKYGLCRQLCWTDDDEQKVTTICKEGDLKPSERAWLSDLKNRVIAEQESVVWTEDDDKIWRDIFDLCNRFGYDDACRRLKSLWELAHGLKSLYISPEDRYNLEQMRYDGYCSGFQDAVNTIEHWRPTEGQINALKVVARGYPSDDLRAIESLLNDLKKFTKNEK